ncbi:MAG TPA: hypothetical protein VJR04_11105 [Terriglobales bacterium]|nr:hypothetical protein [Terriglobales bacterium]
MKYEKPEVVKVDSALAAIQSNGIPKQQSLNDASQDQPSVAAYEADE